MPYCAYCGSEVGTGVAVCMECGHPQGAPAVGQATGYAAPAGTEPLAVTSLVLGIVGVIICPILIPSLLAIVFGLRARRAIERDPRNGGAGLATAGIITGVAGLVVIPVIAALLVPAVRRVSEDVIPSVQQRAQDLQARSSLQTAVTAAKASYTDSQTYRGFNAGTAATFEPSLIWVEDGESTNSSMVSFLVAGDQEIRFAARADSGRCLAVRDVVGVGNLWATHAPGASCRASGFAPHEFSEPSVVFGT